MPEHFQIVAETCGIEIARILIKELGGITVSIPMVNSSQSSIERYIKEIIKEKSFKKIERELRMNERIISNIIRKYGNKNNAINCISRNKNVIPLL